MNDLIVPEKETEGKSMVEIGEHFLSRLDNIERATLLALELPQVDSGLTHYFGEGICVREISLPAGTFAVGHYHTKPTVNLFLQGKVLMLKEDNTTQLLEAPMIFTSYPGRKVGFIVEDMVWQEIWPTDDTDIEKLEAEFLDKERTYTQLNEQRKLTWSD